jgi:predicted polyphosphate/ATP-dependent NAD kinase
MSALKVTNYFGVMRSRPDRSAIKDEWIEQVIRLPEREQVQIDGRIRRWGKIRDSDDRYLRVILLSDGETVHNAFFDRGYKP